MIEFILPLPCSVNELYTVARGRKILSKKGREFRSFLPWLIMDAAKKQLGLCEIYANPIYQQVSIIYSFTFPDNRKRDISNYIKQTEDAIVKARVIRDDSCVMAFSATKTIEKGKRQVRIKIEEIKQEA